MILELIDNALTNESHNQFEFNGNIIDNPFYDENLKEEVNPIEYYGMDNILYFIFGKKDYLLVKWYDVEEQNIRYSNIKKSYFVEWVTVNEIVEYSILKTLNANELKQFM